MPHLQVCIQAPSVLHKLLLWPLSCRFRRQVLRALFTAEGAVFLQPCVLQRIYDWLLRQQAILLIQLQEQRKLYICERLRTCQKLDVYPWIARPSGPYFREHDLRMCFRHHSSHVHRHELYAATP